MSYQGLFWKYLLIPAGFIAIIGSLQMDADLLFGLPTGSLSILGAILAMTTMFLWALSKNDNQEYITYINEIFQKVAHDTNFVTYWVVCSFLIFELTILGTGINLTTMFSDMSHFIIFMSVAIGILPGCGPQIVVTTLYVGGVIPLSAQLGNAISNDGDALFPAIALAPKIAIIATL